MKFLPLLLMITVLLSCNKEEHTFSDLPDCIKEQINDETRFDPIKTVQIQEVDGELHYWLNTDARHWDGGELIVNADCETVCAFCGECIPAPCIKDYEDQEWVIIWKK